MDETLRKILVGMNGISSNLEADDLMEGFTKSLHETLLGEQIRCMIFFDIPNLHLGIGRFYQILKGYIACVRV